MSAAIKLTNLTKYYGKSRGIKDINLVVPKGSIFGFLGPNGAGKTTTISILVDLLRASSGRAEVFGEDIRSNGVKIRKKVGYLSGDMELDGSLTGKQQLEYFGNIRGNYNSKYVNQLAERLESDLSKKIKTLSRGNKQKIGLISALMHRPELLILDEPTSGLDPLIQEQFNEIILDHKKQGYTTFISSHILSEVQELCDYVAFIKEGTLIAAKPITEIADNAPFMVKIISDDKKLEHILSKFPEVHYVKKEHKSFSFNYSGNVNLLLNTIAKFPIIDITITKGDLETTFMEYYKD